MPATKQSDVRKQFSRSADKKSATYQLCDVRNMLSSDTVDSIIFLNKTVFHRILRKMQRTALLPVLLACSLNLNTLYMYAVCCEFSGCENYTFQIKSSVIC